MNHNFEKLEPFIRKENMLTTMQNILDWELQTIMPEGGDREILKIQETIANEYYSNLINAAVEKLLDRCEGECEKERLSPVEAGIVKCLANKFKQLKKIGVNDYIRVQSLSTENIRAWTKAKEKNDFNEWAPKLKELFEVKKSMGDYDTHLDMYEPGFSTAEIDKMFDRIKKEVIPLISQKEAKEPILYRGSVEQQKKWDKFLCEYLGFSLEDGVLGESAHPFTIGISKHDVRIADNYDENDLFKGAFSMLHETGHGLYEQGISEDYSGTIAGTSMGLGFHESQSRFYENIIGRDACFWKPLMDRLKETFPGTFRDVSLADLISNFHIVNPSPIRTEADEVTYPIHVIIRYELEKALFEDKIKVEDLSQEWNKKYKEYLGIDIEDDLHGVLQDVHWAGGDIGYFPSYVIGNCVAAQIYYTIQKDIPF